MKLFGEKCLTTMIKCHKKWFNGLSERKMDRPKRNAKEFCSYKNGIMRVESELIRGSSGWSDVGADGVGVVRQILDHLSTHLGVAFSLT